MTRLPRWLTTLLAPLRRFREQAELARELERQPRAMTAPVERQQDGEVVEVFRRNEGEL